MTQGERKPGRMDHTRPGCVFSVAYFQLWWERQLTPTTAPAALPRKAVGAVDRARSRRTERNLGRLAAFGAYHVEHLTTPAAPAAAKATTATCSAAAAGHVAAAAAPFVSGRLPRITTGGTAPRVVGKAFRGMEFLLAGRKGEGAPTVHTGQGSIGKSHVTSPGIGLEARFRDPGPSKIRQV